MKKNRRNFAIIFISILVIGLANFHCTNQQRETGKRIIIEANFSKYFHWDLRHVFEMKTSVKLQYTPFHYLESAPPITVVEEEMVDGKVKWILHSNEPLYIAPPVGSSVVVYPGDSLHIEYLRDEPVYSGINHASFDLLTELMAANKKLTKPFKESSHNASRLQDFLEWNSYLDNKAATLLPIIETYKDKISEKLFAFYKASTIGHIEYDRINAFTTLLDSVRQGYPGLTYENLKNIWDSTQYKPLAISLRSLEEYRAPIQYIYAFDRLEVWRKFNFDYTNDSLNNKKTRTYLYYSLAKNNYHGLMRERLMAFVLDEQTITELGKKDPMAQTLLKDYYSQPGFPEYKQWVKKLETDAQN